MIWLIVAAFLVIVEVLAQMMWALCLAAGALCAMTCSLCGLDVIWQVVALALGCVAAYIVFLPLAKRWHERSDMRAARTGMDALLGRRAIITHEIRPGQLGRARIDGDNWQVKAPAAKTTIKAGTEVVVTAYDSIILSVEEL